MQVRWVDNSEQFTKTGLLVWLDLGLLDRLRLILLSIELCMDNNVVAFFQCSLHVRRKMVDGDFVTVGAGLIGNRHVAGTQVYKCHLAHECERATGLRLDVDLCSKIRVLPCMKRNVKKRSHR